MKAYSVKIAFLENLDEEMEKNVEQQLCEILPERLNETYDVQQVVNYNGESKDGKNRLFTVSNNVCWIIDFINESKEILQRNNVPNSYNIILIDRIDFIQKSEKSKIRDAVDYISSFVNLDKNLVEVEHEYIVGELHYLYSVKDVFINVVMRASALDKMVIMLTAELDRLSFNTDEFIEILDNEYNRIVGSIDNVTKEED